MSIDNIMNELNNIKNWKKTRKKAHDIYVCKPVVGTKCTNKLEGTQYITSEAKQFILSGTASELWVTGGADIAKTYIFADGESITPESIKKRCDRTGQMDWKKISTKTNADSATVWAFHLPKSIQNFPVKAHGGSILIANKTGIPHGHGDFILAADNNGKPDLSNLHVVNGVVFPKTYDLHSFPNMFNTEFIQAETLKPTVTLCKKIGNKVTEVNEIQNKKTENNTEQNFDRRAKTVKEEFEIVGRYMDKTVVTGYSLKSLSDGKLGKYSKVQVCYLIGRGRVSNCTAQLFKDKILLRGKGISLDDLPVINIENKSLNIVSRIKSGKNIVAYGIQNEAGKVKEVHKDIVFRWAMEKKIDNVRVQKYNGSMLLRGVNCDLKSLPIIEREL